MKQSLQLRLGQQLTLTPQLQQAIRLLQMSTLDLTQEIQTTLNSNLMLEHDEDEIENPKTDNELSEHSSEQILELNKQDKMPDELPVDSQWDDVYEVSNYEAPSQYSEASEPLALTQASNPTTSIYEHLTQQLNLLSLSDDDQTISHYLIDAINDDGYLSISLDEVLETLDQESLEIDEIQMVLHLIQSLDPIGIGARDLQECLFLQLKQLAENTPLLSETLQLIEFHFAALSTQNHNLLKRKLKINQQQLLEIYELIRSLNPKPGNQISDKAAQYVTPDVFVVRHKNKWHVSLNSETTPKLRINSLYAGLIKRADSSKDNITLKDHMQEAKWFLKNLMNRNETVLKVASKIVEFQRPFFDYGEEAMRPLVLKSIADELDMHESTISRVTTQKYMHTPRGTFEFKYFFSSHVSTSTGGECSATAIRALIKKLISTEQSNKPLSDNKLAGLLADQGIKVARRTVAKYREAMAIPPSNERKRLC